YNRATIKWSRSALRIRSGREYADTNADFDTDSDTNRHSDSDADSMRSHGYIVAFERSSDLLWRTVLSFQSVIAVGKHSARLRVRHLRSICADRGYPDERYKQLQG